MSGIELQTVAFFAIFIGALLRIIVAFIDKKKTGTITFDVKYIGVGISAIVAAMTVASLLVSQINIPIEPVPIILLGVGWFLQGWGASDLIAKSGIDWRTTEV